MADRDDLELTYSLLDRIVRLSLGELADFSGAKYDGDFSLTSRRPSGASATTSPSRSASVRADALLDLGCGWGAHAPVRARTGWDWRWHHPVVGAGGGLSKAPPRGSLLRRTAADPATASAGLTRSPVSARSSTSATGAGRQEEVYREVFARVASVLPDHGCFYLQTMVFGRNMIAPEPITSMPSCTRFLRVTPTSGTSRS